MTLEGPGALTAPYKFSASQMVTGMCSIFLCRYRSGRCAQTVNVREAEVNSRKMYKTTTEGKRRGLINI